MVIFGKDCDIHECFDSRFNAVILDVLRDEFHIMEGKFTITIEWKPE